MTTNTITRYTDLFQFLGAIGNIYSGQYVKLVLATSTGIIGDPLTEVDLSVTYNGRNYYLMGNVTVARKERTVVAAMDDVQIPYTTENDLTCEVFKFIQTGILRQRMIDRMTITSGNALDIQDSK